MRGPSVPARLEAAARRARARRLSVRLDPQPGGAFVGQAPAEIGREPRCPLRGIERGCQTGERLTLSEHTGPREPRHREPRLPELARQLKRRGLDQVFTALLAVGRHEIPLRSAATVPHVHRSKATVWTSARRAVIARPLDAGQPAWRRPVDVGQAPLRARWSNGGMVQARGVDAVEVRGCRAGAGRRRSGAAPCMS